MGDDKSLKTDLQATEMFEVVDHRGNLFRNTT